MNHPEPDRRSGFTLLEMLIAGILIILIFSFFASPDLVIHSVCGWFFYLTNTSSKIRFDVSTILQFILACAAFLGLAHYLARSFLPHSEILKTWRLRNSASMLLALFVSFAAGLAFVGTVHQIGWLTREPRIFHSSWQVAQRTQSRNNLKAIGLAALEYNNKWNTFPLGGTLSNRAIPGHSWQTFLLPYLDQLALYEKVNFHQPWFATLNKLPFTTSVSNFKNPAIETHLTQKPDAYAISHYAANSHLAGLGESISLNSASIPDGAAYTLLSGEVTTNFKPWADPTNARDPTLGLNTSPQGFGGPWKGGATGFLMTDGSARMVSKDIDPKILKALATPNGGETVEAF